MIPTLHFNNSWISEQIKESDKEEEEEEEEEDNDDDDDDDVVDGNTTDW